MSRSSTSFLARARFSTFTTAGLFGLAAAAACSSPGSGDGTGSAAAGRQQATGAASLDLPSGFTRLPRSHHPLAQARYDVGPADVTKKAAGSVYLKLSAAQKADREALLLAVQDPRSPSYHQWLAPEDYAARFGATTATIAGVSSFLRSQGLQVDGASPLGTRIGFHGTRDQVQRTFHAEMHDYVVAGKKHFALATPPAVPAELEEVVLGIKGLHDFRPHASSIRHRPLTPDYTLPFSKATSLGPDDFKVLYDTKPLISAGTDGTGVTIAIVGQSYYSTAGLNDFLGKFSLTNRMTDVLVPGTGAQKITGDADEADLDVEWSSAVAPGANIVFVYTGADVDNYGVDDAAAYVVERGRNLVPGTGNGGAQIISESYGGCEAFEPDDADLVGETAAAANLEGITYIASSGDDGAAGCIEEGGGGLAVNVPASLPGVTAVGGTEFPQAALVAPYFVNKAAVEYPVASGGTLFETTWNDLTTDPNTNGDGAGGGASRIFPKPFYQQEGTPADGARDVPDVSLSASPVNLPYYVVLQNGATGFGGTSCSAPSFAGILALVGQAVKANGGPLGLGNVNPLLYKLAKSTPGAFHDIVSGNNDTPCIPGTDPDCPANGNYGGFSAGPGYDEATGLGTIDAANLVAAWTALAPTTTTIATSATTTVTTPVNLTAHVTTTGGGALTGTVSFTFQTTAGPLGAVYSPDGAADESWVLGTVPVTASGSSGDAQLSTLIPPGITGSAFVVALYNGDDTHLASVSSAKAVSVTGSSLALGPTGLTLRPNEKTTLTATGGTAPITWFTIVPDTTCIIDVAAQMENCSDVEALTPTTSATLTAGPQDGTVKVVAMDALGEEALLEVTVAGEPLDAGAPDSGAAPDAAAPVVDSGSPPVTPEDAGSSKPDAAAPTHDASVPVTGEGDAAAPSDGGDAGSDEGSDSGSSGGCSVGRGSRDSTSGAGALLAALAFVVTRRKRRRAAVTR